MSLRVLLLPLGLLVGCAAPPAEGPRHAATTPSPGAVCPPAAPPNAPHGAARPEEPTKPKVDVITTELVRLLNAQDAPGIVALYGALMQRALPVDKTAAFAQGVLSAKGAITGFERVPGKGSTRHGVYRLKAERGEWSLDVTVDDHGSVLGMGLTEPPAPEPAVARSTTPLVLPLEGPFSVFWGGDRLAVNQHVTHKSQRRAADIVVTGADGRTSRGDGKKNEDYLIYGQKVLAVAEGTVITAVDGVPDNVPGSMNPYFTTGNIVIVKHGESLYSAYAHLQPGKLRVKVGARVKQGQVLGLCGNTGNSSEPHLHFQLQDGPRFESSYGVEAVFANVTVKRAGQANKIAEYTFLKGDLVGEPR